MGLFGETQVETNMAEFSAESHGLDCIGDSKVLTELQILPSKGNEKKEVITTQGIRFWSPIQVRTWQNGAQLC